MAFRILWLALVLGANTARFAINQVLGADQPPTRSPLKPQRFKALRGSGRAASDLKSPWCFSVGRILGERGKLVGNISRDDLEGLLIHSDGRLHLFDGATLNPVWNSPPSCPYEPELIACLNESVVLSDPFCVFALAWVNGERQWRYPSEQDEGLQTGDLVDTLRIRQRCRIDDALIIATDEAERRVKALDLVEGRLLWQQRRDAIWMDAVGGNVVIAERKNVRFTKLTILTVGDGRPLKQIDLEISIPTGLEDDHFEVCGKMLIVRDRARWIGLSLPSLERRWAIAVDALAQPATCRASGNTLTVIEHLEVPGPLSAIHAFGGSVRYAGYDLTSGKPQWERYYPDSQRHMIEEANGTTVWSSHPRGILCHRDGRLQLSIEHRSHSYQGAYQRELAWQRTDERLLRIIEVAFGTGGSRRYRPVLIDYDLARQRVMATQAFDDATSPYPVEAAIVKDGVIVLREGELRRYTSE